MVVFLELSSVIVLHLNLVIIYFAGLTSTVRIVALLVLTLMIRARFPLSEQ